MPMDKLILYFTLLCVFKPSLYHKKHKLQQNLAQWTHCDEVELSWTGKADVNDKITQKETISAVCYVH